MQATDKINFLGEMNALAEMYGKTLSGTLLNLYWEDLKKYEIEDVKKAISAHRKDEKAGRFMPKTADLLKHLRGKENKSDTANRQSMILECFVCQTRVNVNFDPGLHTLPYCAAHSPGLTTMREKAAAEGMSVVDYSRRQTHEFLKKINSPYAMRGK